VKLINHLRLVSSLRMSGVVPLLPVYVFMVWTENLFFIYFNMEIFTCDSCGPSTFEIAPRFLENLCISGVHDLCDGSATLLSYSVF
jgi:hypothetical protein